jgi:uncharacterized coiled-coil protein SlyX
MVARQERAIDHITDHVLAEQSTQIEALKKRLAKLESEQEQEQ